MRLNPLILHVFLGCQLYFCGRGIAIAAETAVVTADFAIRQGTIRALHGVNKGPLGPGGLLDVTAEHQALGIPVTRLHDCYWPNPYVVDIHVVFPNFRADPTQPESYHFPTDRRVHCRCASRGLGHCVSTGGKH